MDTILKTLRASQSVHKLQAPPFPIDVVWLWCGLPETPQCRYTEDLRYSIRSVAHNMPWVRKHIIVVQDNFECPAWIRHDYDKASFRFVKLRSFMPTRHLPNYNYHVLHSWLHKIRSLSEHFVLMHDDMFVLRPTPWTCFFTKDGKPINRHYAGPPDHGQHPNHRIPYVRMWVMAINKHSIHNTRIQQQAYPYKKSLLRKYHKKYTMEVEKASREQYLTGERDFDLLRFTTAITSTTGEAVRVETDEYERKKTQHSTTAVVDYFVESTDRQGIASIPVIKPRFFIINNTSSPFSHVYDMLKKLFPKQTTQIE